MKSKKSQQSELRLALPRENAHLFGHDQILADIFTAYNKKSMPGGWLISGVAGIGKATLAYRIAKFVLYHGKKGTSGLFGSQESADLSVPQNSQSSLKVSAGTHPDLLVLESGGDDEKSIRGDILIEDARKIANFLHITPSETPYRIVIIDSIDDMNANAANSILKLLEEPPANSMFILISHAPCKLLPTIRSRCRNIRMHKPSDYNALKIFKMILPDVSEEHALSLMDISGNSPGMACDLYVNKGLEIYGNIIDILKYLPQLDVMSIQKLGDKISGKANKHYWHAFKVLFNKIIMDITRQTALNERLHAETNKPLKLSFSISAEKLVEIWQEINNILEDTDNLNLDRKAAIHRIFSLLHRN